MRLLRLQGFSDFVQSRLDSIQFGKCSSIPFQQAIRSCTEFLRNFAQQGFARVHSSEEHRYFPARLR